MAALVVVLPSVVTTIPTLGYCEAVADVVAFAIPFGMDRRHRYWCHRSGVVDDRNQEVGKEGYLSVESFLCLYTLPVGSWREINVVQACRRWEQLAHVGLGLWNRPCFSLFDAWWTCCIKCSPGMWASTRCGSAGFGGQWSCTCALARNVAKAQTFQNSTPTATILGVITLQNGF